VCADIPTLAVPHVLGVEGLGHVGFGEREREDNHVHDKQLRGTHMLNIMWQLWGAFCVPQAGYSTRQQKMAIELLRSRPTTKWLSSIAICSVQTIKMFNLNCALRRPGFQKLDCHDM
jgi:hypothetical protein